MKVGILGWYHQNNAGDDRILYCLRRKLEALGVSEIQVFLAWDELKTNLEEINACDFLIVGGGGLILRNTNRLVAMFQTVTIPYAFIGVSIDSVGDDNLHFIAHIAKAAKCIVVRDRFSYGVFKEHAAANLHLAPDLTFLYPYQKASKRVTGQSKVAVSLRPWRPNLFKQYTRNYHRFNKLVHKFPFIVNLLGLWDVKRFTNLLKKITETSIEPFPLHINEVNGDNLLMHQYFGAAENLTFDIESLRQSDYLLGMRLHSIIFATQLETPFIAISYASKIDNYLEDIGLSEYMVTVNNYKALPEKIRLMKTNRSAISGRLSEVTHQYSKDIHKIMDTVFKNDVL